MKRSQIISLLAGGTALAGIYAFDESRQCRPDALGETSPQCSRGNSSGGGSGGSRGSSSSYGAYSSNSTVRGGFGSMGFFHGGGS